MNTHEYQAKEVLQRYNIPIPDFGVAKTVHEAEQVMQNLGLAEAVVKIQVHAGGRGKAGGVKLVKGKGAILDAVGQLLGMKMVNNQTGPQGVIAQRILLTRPVDIEKEYYLGAILDRERAMPVLIASPEGGMEIEEVAAKTPERILKLPIGLDGRIRSYHLVRLAHFMGWQKELAKQGMKIAAGLGKAFIETDASLLEINPLVKTPDGRLFAVDAKLSVDENALFRQQEIAGFYDPAQVPPSEVAANEYDLSYISLQGNIGCMVNGAGLAMATMDIIQHFGAQPANFLDVGGSADKAKVAAGFKIILSDPQVKAILVNIFGGIMNCATIAEGVIAAVEETGIAVPLVVRLEGTNVEKGREILHTSGLKIMSALSMSDAAEQAAKAVT